MPELSANMAEMTEVEAFLGEFRRQWKESGILFYQRKKNLQALADLEITAKQRNKVLKGLQVQDYYKGPRADKMLKGTDFWEFGKEVKGIEIYIKISLGLEGKSVRCLSFHPAERTIDYPFKPDNT